jgi:hypothetical protein
MAVHANQRRRIDQLAAPEAHPGLTLGLSRNNFPLLGICV